MIAADPVCRKCGSENCNLPGGINCYPRRDVRTGEVQEDRILALEAVLLDCIDVLVEAAKLPYKDKALRDSIAASLERARLALKGKKRRA